MEFTTIFDGINAGQLVTVLVAAAAVIAMLGFASWGAKKVARFFNDGDGGSGGWQSGDQPDRTLDGFYSSGGNSVGIYQWSDDEKAVHKSVDRHMRKR